MRIGIDLDGVCYQWDKTARYMLREVLPGSPYKTGPLTEESKSWNYIEDNVSRGDWNWLWTDGVKLGLFRHGHLFPGTIKALGMLSQLGELHAVTTRPEQAIADTYQWIAYHKLPLTSVTIMSHGSKADTLPCDLFIDDKPQNCTDLVECWPDSVICLLDRPWNTKEITPAGVIRIRDWNDYIKLAIARRFKS